MLSARSSRVALALVLALCPVLGAYAAAPASAHSVLQSTTPADGESVDVAPAQVTLTFNEPAIAMGTQLSITDPTGAVISTEPPQLIDATVVQPLAGDLPAGQYTVQWRVVSADAHPITGTFAFTATGPAAVPTPAAALDQSTAAALSTPASEPTTAATEEDPAPRAAPATTDQASFPIVPTVLVTIAGLAVVIALVLARARRTRIQQDQGSPD